MTEYIYASQGKPLADEHGEISLAREEIVRCRDCAKWYPTHVINNVRLGGCGDPAIHAVVDENGFCAWSERREGAES